ncbi:MAG: sulfite exporter TauE/SafE family protein [Chloroflexi bacterium]|nr:sulfite exporter TauE/SafE family protein [Chloroflexota bacterium]
MLEVEISPLVAAAVVATSLVAALIGGVTGMSTGIIAIPILIFAFGIRLAVPIVTVAMLLNTLSRSVANRDYVDWRVARWYSLGAVPAAAIGGVVFANIPTDWLARALGVFLLALVVYRHIPLLAGRAMPLRAFLPVGIGQGFFSALFGGAGPFGAHFFMAYGLTKNAFVGTVAVGTFLVSIVKTVVYGGFSLFTMETFLIAVGIGLIMAVGAYAGAHIVKHVPERLFIYAVEFFMIVSGLLLLATG